MRKNTVTVRKAFGFTLIELLIVVAIIAILAAIAVPNFLEAQVRAKVARVKADMRTLATALEAYNVDTNKYPPGREPNTGGDQTNSLFRLTTPIAYVTSSSMVDPFIVHGALNRPTNRDPLYFYFCYAEYGRWAISVMQSSSNFQKWGFHAGWCLKSAGPNRIRNGGEWMAVRLGINNKKQAMNFIYDATNGTISHGDIMRTGGDVGEAMSYN
jgi:prepilin-type N-terminal cleavage/methylation domain-containing protein